MSVERKFKTQTEWVVQNLRDAILSGEIKPGEKLRQEVLAQQLGTSPTPVREAFRQLEVEGLIVHHPHKGVRVGEFSIKDAEDIYLIRRELEGLAAELAVSRSENEKLEKIVSQLENLQREMEASLARDDFDALSDQHDDFHMVLYEASNSSRLCQMILSFRTLFPHNTLWVIPGRAARSMEEHREILESVRSGDPKKAGDQVREHIMDALQALVEHLQRVRPEASSRDGLDDVLSG